VAVVDQGLSHLWLKKIPSGFSHVRLFSAEIRGSYGLKTWLLGFYAFLCG
jgi:hypothetical protein